LNSERKFRWSRPARGFSFGLLTVVCFFFTEARTYADTIYVANNGNSTIEEFNSSGVGTVFADASEGVTRPWGLAVDSSGNLYVANAGNDTIERFNMNGIGTVFANASKGVSTPTGLGFDSSGNLYVANQGNNTIERFDSNGNQSGFATSVINPGWLAVDRYGNVYVTVANNTIEKFDANRVGSVFATASSGLAVPGGLAFDSSENLCEPNWGSPATIMKFDSSGIGAVFATSSLSAPTGLAFGSSGNLYATFFGSRTIEEFDTNGVGTVFANTGLDNPMGIALLVPEPSTWAMLAMGIATLGGGLRLRRRLRMKTGLSISSASFALSLLLLVAPGTSRAQNLFVSNYGNNTIEEFNPSGVGTVFASRNSVLGGSLINPTGLAFDSQGNLYVNNYAGPIWKLNSSGVGTEFGYTVVDVTEGLQGLAFDKNGNLYVSCDENLSIYEFTPSGGQGTIFATAYVTPHTGYINPIGLAFDSSGNLFATSQYGGSTITEFNTNGVGGLFTYSGPGLNAVNGLAIDKNGNLYVSNYGNNTIEEFSTNGVGRVFASSGLDLPAGLAFDSAGNLYVANFGNNTIEEFNTNGVGTVFANSGLDDPLYLAFQPVPEPSTWAMVLLGFGVVLGGLRFRYLSRIKATLAVSTTSLALTFPSG